MRLISVVAVLVFAPVASAQSCQRLHFLEVDSTKTYQAGQKIKYDEPHGVYTGMLETNKLYFVCPVTLTVTKRGSLAKGETFEEGTISLFIRKSVDAKWTRTVFAYKCEDLELNPGKMEYAVFNGSQIQVGSHNALCEFSKSK